MPLTERGIALFNAGRLEEAERCFAAAGRRDFLELARRERERRALREAQAAEARRLAAMARVRADLLAGRFGAAFSACEELARTRDQETLEHLMFPLMEVPDRELRARPGLAAGLAAHARRNPRSRWPALVRAYLFHRLATGEQAVAEAEKLADAGWMRFLLGKLLLHVRRDYARAEREFAAAAQDAPGLMMARAYVAETLLCRGRTARALSILRSLADSFEGRIGADARAWRGEVLLWLGRYREAVRELDRAAAAGARFARGWRGAALSKLGRLEEALADLDAALAEHPDDQEMLTWRGETLRRLGRRKESLRDLDAALRMPLGSPWAAANRALLLGEGDPQAHEALLRAGRGIRRADPYLEPIWAGSRTSRSRPCPR